MIRKNLNEPVSKFSISPCLAAFVLEVSDLKKLSGGVPDTRVCLEIFQKEL